MALVTFREEGYARCASGSHYEPHSHEDSANRPR